jgi:hypothetical protein
MQELRQFEQISFGGISLSGSNPVCDQVKNIRADRAKPRNACGSAHKTPHRLRSQELKKLHFVSEALDQPDLQIQAKKPRRTRLLFGSYG